MKKRSAIFLVIAFLGTTSSVPITQAVIELLDDETPQALALFRKIPSEENLRQFEKDLEEYSFFEEQLRPLFQVANYLLTGDMGSKAIKGYEGWSFYTPGVRYLTEPYYRETNKTDQDPVETIADFGKQLEKKNIKLIVVPVPGKSAIYPEKLNPFEDIKSPVYENTKKFIQALRTRGITVTELHEHFTAQKPSPLEKIEHLYMKTDTHWSGGGVRVAASKIANDVRRILKKRYSNKLYLRKSMIVERIGDIPRMTNIPFQNILFQKEHVKCYRVFNRETGEPYQDSRDSEILVLGDSFSRVFQTDEPGSAGIISNLAYELGVPLASIVNDGGASTLTRQQLAMDIEILKGKRLVIWEFVERDIRFGISGWQKIKLFE